VINQVKVDDFRTRVIPEICDRVAVAIIAVLQALVLWQMSLKCAKLVLQCLEAGFLHLNCYVKNFIRFTDSGSLINQ
jgi:hypothetical protein